MKNKQFGWIISAKSNKELRFKALCGILLSFFIVRDLAAIKLVLLDKNNTDNRHTDQMNENGKRASQTLNTSQLVDYPLKMDVPGNTGKAVKRGQWKGTMKLKNVAEAVESVTTTGKPDLEPDGIKFIKRGCK